VNQIPLFHNGLILTSDRASIAAVVSEAAVAINQGFSERVIPYFSAGYLARGY